MGSLEPWFMGAAGWLIQLSGSTGSWLGFLIQLPILSVPVCTEAEIWPGRHRRETRICAEECGFSARLPHSINPAFNSQPGQLQSQRSETSMQPTRPFEPRAPGKIQIWSGRASCRDTYVGFRTTTPSIWRLVRKIGLVNFANLAHSGQPHRYFLVWESWTISLIGSQHPYSLAVAWGEAAVKLQTRSPSRLSPFPLEGALLQSLLPFCTACFRTSFQAHPLAMRRTRIQLL